MTAFSIPTPTGSMELDLATDGGSCAAPGCRVTGGGLVSLVVHHVSLPEPAEFSLCGGCLSAGIGSRIMPNAEIEVPSG